MRVSCFDWFGLENPDDRKLKESLIRRGEEIGLPKGREWKIKVAFILVKEK